MSLQVILTNLIDGLLDRTKLISMQPHLLHYAFLIYSSFCYPSTPAWFICDIFWKSVPCCSLSATSEKAEWKPESKSFVKTLSRKKLPVSKCRQTDFITHPSCTELIVSYHQPFGHIYNVSLSYICDVWQILPPLGFPNDVLPDVDPMHCELTIALQSNASNITAMHS